MDKNEFLCIRLLIIYCTQHKESMAEGVQNDLCPGRIRKQQRRPRGVQPWRIAACRGCHAVQEIGGVSKPRAVPIQIDSVLISKLRGFETSRSFLKVWVIGFLMDFSSNCSC